MGIFAFMNQKGGVGKTTTAVSVGALLAHEHGKNVLLIDLDPQGNLSDHLGIDPNVTERSIYNVVIDGMPPAEVLRRAHGMDVLPANLDLSAAEAELAVMENRDLRLKDAVADFCAAYDYVLLDCPPSLGLLTISGLVLSTKVVVPMQAEYLALRGLSQLLQTIDLVRERLNPDLEVAGVVFCKFDSRTLLAQGVRQEVEAFFPGRVYEAVVRKNIRLAEAPSHGLPVDLYDKACRGVEDYRAVTREFLQRETTGPVSPSIRAPVWKGDEVGEAAGGEA